MLSKTKLLPSSYSSLPGLILNVMFVLSGSFLVALAMNVFYIPSKFVAGGLGGVSIIGFYTLGINPSIIIILLNVPLLLTGYLLLKSPSSLIYTMIGFLSNAFFLEITKSAGAYLFIPDDIIRSIFGGLVVGTGQGIILRNHGSLGGTDIVGMILREKLGMKIGMVNLSFNLIIMGAAGFIFEPYKAMYSILASFFVASVADRILGGFENRKAVFIFSSRARELVKTIGETTGYHAILIPRIELQTDKPDYLYIIYTITPASRVSKIRAITQEVDPTAFISISEISEIMGLWNPQINK